MAISRDTVIWGFRLILGREPESEEGIRSHQGLADEKVLVETLLRSPELKSSGRFANTLELKQASAVRTKSVWPYESTGKLKVSIFGNCQVTSVGRLMQALSGDVIARTFETTPSFMRRLREGAFDLKSAIDGADLVFVQMVGEIRTLIENLAPGHTHKLRQFPAIAYAGFHPDCIYVGKSEGGQLQGPMGEYQSSIALWAWQQGLTVEQAVALFRDEVYDALGFHRYHDAAYKALVTQGMQCDLALHPLVDKWRLRGCFMHTVNHPKLHALADVTALLLRREGIEPIEGAAEWVPDHLARWPVWPVYPPLAQAVGQEGSYRFKLDQGLCPDAQPVLSMDLPAFVKASFSVFKACPPESLHSERIQSDRYKHLSQFVAARPSRVKRLASKLGLTSSVGPEVALGQVLPVGNPYSKLPDYHYWKRSVSSRAGLDNDPVISTKFTVDTTDKIATAGSCFAQHIARSLQVKGFNYIVVDRHPGITEEQAKLRGFGMFSARYGNIYTARQLLQLFDRAHGIFKPLDRGWKRADGRYVDPFRPQIEPAGAASLRDTDAAAKRHLIHVQRMFAQLDVFVFTLGLTEAWRRKQDGAVFPLAPGVAGGSFDPTLYEFINFSYEDILQDMRSFLQRLRQVNERARIILTVSPVPLIATYEDQHVVVSNSYSKAVLRAVAGVIAAENPSVDYFPSYEIITGPQSSGAYFEEDRRSVAPEGVAQVMRVFFDHYAKARSNTQKPQGKSPRDGEPAIEQEQRHLYDIVCDEEALDRHRGH